MRYTVTLLPKVLTTLMSDNTVLLQKAVDQMLIETEAMSRRSDWPRLAIGVVFTLTIVTYVHFML